jgi:hypothetical protein
MHNKTVNCGQCRFEFRHGAHVCQGCQGDIIYGPTKTESSDATKWGAILAASIAAALVYGIPLFLNSKLQTSIANGFGLGAYGAGLVAVSGFAGAAYAAHYLDRSKAGVVRTFRRSRIR